MHGKFQNVRKSTKEAVWQMTPLWLIHLHEAAVCVCVFPVCALYLLCTGCNSEKMVLKFLILWNQVNFAKATDSGCKADMRKTEENQFVLRPVRCFVFLWSAIWSLDVALLKILTCMFSNIYTVISCIWWWLTDTIQKFSISTTIWYLMDCKDKCITATQFLIIYTHCTFIGNNFKLK